MDSKAWEDMYRSAMIPPSSSAHYIKRGRDQVRKSSHVKHVKYLGSEKVSGDLENAWSARRLGIP